MLLDSFGRRHNYLRISLIDKCNFRCIYCLPHSPHNKKGFNAFSDQKLMTADEIYFLAKVFVRLGVDKIRLTGGEPLLRKDAKQIIERLSSLGAELTLTTNASHVGAFIDTFKTAGIKSVNVSLDSLNAAAFLKLTGRNEFSNVLENIQLLIRNNFHVKVNVVVMKGYNDHEICDFVAWTRSSPVHVRFIEFMPFPGNEWNSGAVISYKQILEQIESRFPILEKLTDQAHDTAKKFKVKNHEGTFAVISTMSEPFCGGCNRMRLTADGKMRNCLFSKTETDLLAPLRNGQDVEPRIHECLKGKHFSLGGHGAKWEVKHSKSQERSMLAIGG